MSHDFTKLGFVNTYVYPALALFLIPVLSLVFFYYTQGSYDHDFQEAVSAAIRTDQQMAPEEKADALAFYEAVPLSTVLASNDPALAEVQNMVPSQTQLDYAVFRWAIRIAWGCILAAVGAFVFLGASVVMSLRSQWAQYYSLLAGWHALRIFATLQVIAQALLVFALGFWVQVFFFEAFFVKITLLLGIVCLFSVFPVIMAIFRKLDNEFTIEGEVLDRDTAPRLWYDLDQLSAEMGIAPPDQVVAGIDDNFFVTQTPVTVAGKDGTTKKFTGKTLFVSLSLLKKLPGREADAVLLHELAHFSGEDTLYSQRISPLLMRFQNYLEGLYAGVVARPVFYFAVLFRALYEISLGKLSRQREFRADRLAAEKTSPQDMANALLRITAYSQYRASVEKEFFDAEQAHEQVAISQRIDDGFPAYVSAFVEKRDIGDLASAHPFDSHPPMDVRLKALGFVATAEAMREALEQEARDESAEGSWFQKILGAETIERDQWSAYEERFRQFHENVLAYRYLPETDEQRELVERFFPRVERTAAKDRPGVFDYEKVMHEDWEQPIYYHEIKNMTLENEWGTRLDLAMERDGKKKTVKLPLSKDKTQQQEIIGTLEQYFTRYAAAVAYQAEQVQQAETIGDDSPVST